ncbi:MAG: phage protein Gp37 [Sphingobium sp.]
MIAAIERAILHRLHATEALVGFPWRRLDTLPDDWENYLETKVGELRGAAAWVGFTGWSNAEEAGDGAVHVDGTFGLIVAQASSRQDEVANRHGGPNASVQPGVYRLDLAVTAALSGQTLGLDLVRPIAIGDCQPLPRSAKMKALGMTAHGLMLSCRFPIQIAPADVADLTADDLAAIHANWATRPGMVDADPVAPGVQLPDDIHATATDHIPLQGDAP